MYHGSFEVLTRRVIQVCCNVDWKSLAYSRWLPDNLQLVRSFDRVLRIHSELCTRRVMLS
jgi:hypothetical protein